MSAEAGDEFPPGASEPPQGLSRRAVLELAAFGASAAGLSGCFRQPPEKVMPYSQQPPEVTPGVPLHYATGLTLEGYVRGLVVRSYEGRPTKVEGNPESPLFGGGTCAVGQATVLSLYDDDRLRGPLWQGTPASWDDVDAHIDGQLRRAAADRGRVVLLTNTITGPATRDLIGRWSRRYPGFQHVVYEPVSFTAIVIFCPPVLS